MKPIHILQNNKHLNDQEFIYYFEHKVLYTIRKYNLLDKKQKQEISIKDLLEKDKIGNIIISHDCLDDISLKVLEVFMKKNAKKELKTLLPSINDRNKKVIRPFYFVSRKEIELYIKLKKINKYHIKNNRENKTLQRKYNDIDNSSKLLISWLDSLEQKHPEVKNAIVNSLLRIEKFL
jgi:tRNA(Ile)-lysidine synthase TilS/MesJ